MDLGNGGAFQFPNQKDMEIPPSSWILVTRPSFTFDYNPVASQQTLGSIMRHPASVSGPQLQSADASSHQSQWQIQSGSARAPSQRHVGNYQKAVMESASQIWTQRQVSKPEVTASCTPPRIWTQIPLGNNNTRSYSPFGFNHMLGDTQQQAQRPHQLLLNGKVPLHPLNFSSGTSMIPANGGSIRSHLNQNHYFYPLQKTEINQLDPFTPNKGGRMFQVANGQQNIGLENGRHNIGLENRRCVMGENRCSTMNHTVSKVNEPIQICFNQAPTPPSTSSFGEFSFLLEYQNRLAQNSQVIPNHMTVATQNLQAFPNHMTVQDGQSTEAVKLKDNAEPEAYHHQCVNGIYQREREDIKISVNQNTTRQVDSPSAGFLPQQPENPNQSNGGNVGIDLNNTLHVKRRRRKYTPKVIQEGKPTKKPRKTIPKSAGSAKGENPSGKRKNVWKQKTNDGTPSTEIGKTGDHDNRSPVRESVKRALHFGSELPNIDDAFQYSTLTSNCNEETRVRPASYESKQVGSDLKISINGVTDNHNQPYVTLVPPQFLGKRKYVRKQETNDGTPSTKIGKTGDHDSRSPVRESVKRALHFGSEPPNIDDAFQYSTLTSNCNEETRVLPASYESKQVGVDLKISINGVTDNHNQPYVTLVPPQFLGKRKYVRKQEINDGTPSTKISITGDHDGRSPVRESVKRVLHFGSELPNIDDGFQYSTLASNCKKETRVLPASYESKQVGSDLKISINGVTDNHNQPYVISGQPQFVHSRRKLLQKNIDNLRKGRENLKIGSSTSFELQVVHQSFPGNQLISSFPSHYSLTDNGTGTMNFERSSSHFKPLNPVDVNAEKFKYLMISEGPVENRVGDFQPQNAIVPYGGHGTIIPFEDPVSKKRLPRAKVDLDPETNRVWLLLMGNECNETGEAMNKEKEKWWEEERRVFQGRVDSFISRMHLIQGDRRFSKWKGSVVDSVVGVFLTQNVSDHLSSSAFMILVAKYPPSQSENRSSKPNMSIPTEKQGETISEIDDDVKLDNNVSDQHYLKQSSKLSSKTQITCQKEIEEGEVAGNVTETSKNSSTMYEFFIPTDKQGETISEIDDDIKLDNNVSDQHYLKQSSKLLSKTLITCQKEIEEGELAGNVTETSKNPSTMYEFVKNSIDVTDPVANLSNCRNPFLYDSIVGADNQHPQQQASGGVEFKAQISNDRPCELLSESTNVGIILESQFPMGSHSSPIVVEEKAKNVAEPKKKIEKEEKNDFDWDSLRKDVYKDGSKKERNTYSMDSINWEAVSRAPVKEIANAIQARGMNNLLAERIKAFLDRLVQDHGSIDLEWLRDAPPDKAKDYLLSIRGLGLKSVECVRLLTLHHLAFPVDTNVGRICVRLGWVPLRPLPGQLHIHLLEMYPMLETIQRYLWPRLCKLDQRTLYELHYQLITFGKVFCTKTKPNCNACPMRGECKHFASAFASARLALPGPEEKSLVPSKIPIGGRMNHNPASYLKPLPQLEPGLYQTSTTMKSGPIVEFPASPERECSLESAIEDTFCDGPRKDTIYEASIEDTIYEAPPIEDTIYEDPPIEDIIPIITLDIGQFTENVHDYIRKSKMAFKEDNISKALVSVTADAAIPQPKLKNIGRLRTEHLVYELPDSHPLLEGQDERQTDDPSPYLLAIWTPGETAHSTEQYNISCDSQSTGKLCQRKTCFSCNSIKEAQAQKVRGTLLIPCRTAMRGSFPLNGTYFQVNEVFADHASSLEPIDVPRTWLWNLPRRTVYFGSSVTAIFRGLTTEGIQQCFWRGFICVRGFDQKTRVPRPLITRLHQIASKVVKNKKIPVKEPE